MNTEEKFEIEKETLSYIIKTLLNRTNTANEFKKFYGYVTSLMVEEGVYSLTTTVRTSE